MVKYVVMQGESRILRSGSKAPDKMYCRNHGSQDPGVYVVFWAPRVLHQESPSPWQLGVW